MVVNSIKVTIIIPVFNGEQYLNETIDSFVNQTYNNWELICVDDGSTDRSINILNKYSQHDNRIKVYKKTNEGIAAKGVKLGLKFATGDYFMYSSQDDLVSKRLLEYGVERVKETKADFVLPDMKWYFEKKYIDKYQGLNGDRECILSGNIAFLLSLDWQIHGFGLIDMNLVKSIGWYDYGYNSDEYTTRVIFYNAKKVAFSKGVFYYRQDNPNAITKKISFKLFDALETNTRLIKFIIGKDLGSEYLIRMNNIAFKKLRSLLVIYFNNKNLLSNAEKKSIIKKMKSAYDFIKKDFLKPTNYYRFEKNSFVLFYVKLYIKQKLKILI